MWGWCAAWSGGRGADGVAADRAGPRRRGRQADGRFSEATEDPARLTRSRMLRACWCSMSLEAVDPLRAGDPQDPSPRTVDSGGTMVLSGHVDGAGRGPSSHVAIIARGELLAAARSIRGRALLVQTHRPRRRRRRSRGGLAAGVLSSEHVRTALGTGRPSRGDLREGALRMQLRLKWTLWKRSYRKNVGKLIGTIIRAVRPSAGQCRWVPLPGDHAGTGEGETFPLIVRGWARRRCCGSSSRCSPSGSTTPSIRAIRALPQREGAPARGCRQRRR